MSNSNHGGYYLLMWCVICACALGVFGVMAYASIVNTQARTEASVRRTQDRHDALLRLFHREKREDIR